MAVRRRKYGSLAQLIPYPVDSREYKRAWAQLNPERIRKLHRVAEIARRRSVTYRARKAAEQKRYWSKNREKKNEAARKWRAEHKWRVKILNREYRRLQGLVCHFCHEVGSREHPLRRISRSVEVEGNLVQRKVPACHVCRAA